MHVPKRGNHRNREYFLRNRNNNLAHRLDCDTRLETISNNPRLPTFHWREHFGGPIAVAVLTQFRLLAIAGAMLALAYGGQALAFWPFGGSTRIALSPAYGGVCEDCDLSGRILAGNNVELGVQSLELHTQRHATRRWDGV